MTVNTCEQIWQIFDKQGCRSEIFVNTHMHVYNVHTLNMCLKQTNVHKVININPIILQVHNLAFISEPQLNNQSLLSKI